ncbi:hypothetical protein Patl1_10617 [Pistacia atlantica]|uniref:Uncharacterized protein n=1 Tax=Pistacia atlantica TaxID=434234 RepID=A0ACC1A8S8_9ROSI|nr:hypothetical protein Patl1_10617 [Pistacia atlantica]
MFSGSTGQSSNSNSYNRHACAACKHQRKKCYPGLCVLAPFFPANKPEEFKAIHKLFGVKNLAKMLSCLDERDRRVAVLSYVWEAKLWMEDPVNGPLGHYNRLNQELQHVKHINRLLIQQIQLQSSPHMSGIGPQDYVTSQGRQPMCNITSNPDVISSNCHCSVQNSYATDVQKEECKGQGTTSIPTPQSTIVQGQERLSQGRDVTLAHPAYERGERNTVLDGGSSSANFGSIRPVEQQTTNSHSRAPDYQRTTNHHGRDQSGHNSGSFWPEQQRGSGQIASNYVDSLQKFSQNIFSSCWDNCVNIDGYTDQQPQDFPNNNQIGYFNVQGKHNTLFWYVFLNLS